MRVNLTCRKLVSRVARSPVTILLLLALGVPSLCAAEEPSGFLMRQRLRIIWESEGFDSITETVIFRDGLIVTTSISPDETFIRRRQASPEALRRLHGAFRRYRIGNQTGDCHGGTTPFDFFLETITYFTEGPKGKTIRTGDAFPRLCGLRLRLLKDEIFTFVNTAAAEPGLQEVLVPN